MPNAAAPQVTPTYDGSGQVTEPTLEFFPNGWNGYKYWLLVSPYPDFNQNLENPSILVSQDGVDWSIPAGLSNPLALPANSNDHLDDGTLFFDPSSGQLWLYYLEQGIAEILKRRVSSDGIHWSDARDLFRSASYQLVSPTIQFVNGRYFMWSVNAGSSGCSATKTTVEYRTSSDGITWSDAQPTDLLQPINKVWHINVRWIPEKGEFWAMYSGFPGNCGSDNLFFATSADGVHWNAFLGPLLSRHHGHWDGDTVYRATGFYDSSTEELRVWYAGRAGPVWHLGYTHENFQKVMNALLQK